MQNIFPRTVPASTVPAASNRSHWQADRTSTGMDGSAVYGLPSRMFDIDGRIVVSVMDRVTGRTGPGPHVQGQPLQNISTMRTTLTTRIPAVNLVEVSPVPGGLIVELPKEFTPPHIRNMFGQTMVAHHVFHTQRLRIDGLILAYQAGTQLMQVVETAAGNLVVDFRDTQTGLASVLRSFLFAAQATLRQRKPSFVLRCILRIADLLTFGCCQQMGQPYVNANLFCCRRHLLHRLIHAQTHEILTSGRLTQRHGCRLSFERTRPFDPQPAHLGELQGLRACVPGKGGFRVGRRLFPVSLLERRVRRSFLKKIDESSL